MTVSDLFLPLRAKAWPVVADQQGEIWWTGGHCGQGMGLWDSQACLQICPAVRGSILPKCWYLIIPYQVTGFTVPHPSQQSGYCMPLMVGYVINESMNPHTGIKGNVKDCGRTHMKLEAWWKADEIATVQSVWGTNTGHSLILLLNHRLWVTIPLHSFSWPQIEILTHSQTHSIFALLNGSRSHYIHIQTHFTHQDTNHLSHPDLLWMWRVGK